MTAELTTTAMAAMLEKITPGEWFIHKHRRLRSQRQSFHVGNVAFSIAELVDAEFIAAAPATVRQLLGQNAELSRQLAEEKGRADTNFAPYERIKGLYSDVSSQLADTTEKAMGEARQHSIELDAMRRQLAEARAEVERLTVLAGRDGAAMMNEIMRERDELQRKLEEAEVERLNYMETFSETNVGDD